MTKKATLLLLFACLFSGYISRGQLAGGTYTINSAVPTGGTNYISFTAAIGAMASGVSGPVVFNVVAGSGPYTEQAIIGNITGASATNTIKFNGNGAVVQFTPTATYSGILMMNGAKYTKFDSLTFKSLSTTYGYGAILYNGCNYDSITRCTFDLTNVVTTASANSMGIRISSTVSGTSSTVSGATNTYLGRNSILGTTGNGGPYYGLYFYGPNTNNVYNANYISNYYYYGIYDYYGTGISYINNILTRETKVTTTGGYYGLYLYYTGAGSKVTGNRIRNLGGATPSASYSYPFNIMYATGTAINPVLVSNNAIYNNTLAAYYGVRLYYCNYTNLYHNTVDIRDIVAYSATSYGFYIYGNTNSNVRNNNASITGGGTSTKYGHYISNNSTTAIERNNLYVNSSQAGTQAYAYLDGTVYNTLANFQAATSVFEAGSVSVDPQFVAPATGNLVPTNTAMFGKGLNLQTVVPTDIAGQARLAAPAPGCYEFQANGSNNAGMVGITEPLGRYCPGPVPVKVTVYNGGTNNITSLKINWSLNGVVQPQYSYTGTLTTLTSTTGSPVATVTLGNAPLSADVPVGIKVWTSQPNATADVINTNDTLSDTLRAVRLTIDAAKDTVCLNRGAVIVMTPNNGFTTGALQWENSTNAGGVWTPIANSDVTGIATPNLSANTWFRVKMVSGSNTCYSDTSKIYITDPQLLSHTPDTARCGPGPVTLHAQSSAAAQVKWFNSPNSTTPVATGSDFTTPYLGITDTFYVSAGVPDAQPDPVNVIVNGTQTTSSTTYMPFYGYNSSTKTQYIVSAADMSAQGYSAGFVNSVGLVAGTLSAPNVGDITVSMKLTTATTAATTFEPGMQTVYTATGVTLTPNTTNTMVFQTPFYWDGISNIYIAFCKANASGSGGNTFTAVYNAALTRTAYAYNSSVNLCTGGSSTVYTSYYIPHMIFGMTGACETVKQPIKVTVNPVPVVDLGPDINKCVDEGAAVVLDAGLQPNNGQYAWDNGSASQVRSVNQSGPYHVIVTNQYGCVGSDSINVLLRKNPVVQLGNDTTICNGATLVLNAGNEGIDYFWNTGETSQVITISSAGTYNVFVTNSQACVTTDTISVIMQGELPTIQGIQVTNNGQHTFQFTAVNPQNVIGFDWDFGDSSAHSYLPSPTHTYSAAGNYVVTLSLSSSCGFNNQVSSAQIVGIHQLNVGNEEMSVYPNPSRGTATILNKGKLRMEEISVYNITGQVVYKAAANSTDKHSLELKDLASGIYTIIIHTDKGTVTRKLDILR